MRNLSKSKLLAFRQCSKRLWLEIHHPESRQDSAVAQAGFKMGHQVGDIARQVYDPKSKGNLIDAQSEGFPAAFQRSAELLAAAKPVPIFEAGFSAAGALAFADVMLPSRKAGERVWRMVEVKSSTSVKNYHRDDVAIQSFVAMAAGVPLRAIALAHIDSSWVYPGGGDYEGLLQEHDLTDEAFGRHEEVASWIAGAQKVARKRSEPNISTGSHCSDPFECGFLSYCQSQEVQTEYPIHWLPKIQSTALKSLIANGEVTDLRDVDDNLLNARQLRVKKHTLSGEVYFDVAGARADLASYQKPSYFLDFETIQFAVPIWKGTRPYQQIPFQFSLHRLARNGKLTQQSFLDLSGKDPSKAFAEALILACGKQGPVYVYNAQFENSRMKELAARFPRLRQALLAIVERVVDLYRIAEQRYYHPSQQGSWSIKKVLPAIAPELSYESLDGIQHGGMAMDGYLEAITPSTSVIRKAQIEQQLLAYCSLDTFAMIRLWQFFTGQK